MTSPCVGIASQLATLTGHISDVTCVRFCDNIVATASSDKTIRLWSVNDPERGISELPYSPLLGHKYTVHCCIFSPSGSLLVTCSTDGYIILWNPKNGAIVGTLMHPSQQAVRVCCFSPDSAYLASGGEDDQIAIWDVASLCLLRIFTGHEATIPACSFAPDCLHLVTGSVNGDLRLWNVHQTRQIAFESEAHDLGVTGCDFSPEWVRSETHQCKTYLMASCGNDNVIYLWRISVGSRPGFMRDATLQGHEGNIMCCQFSPSGEYLASASGDKTVIIWNPVQQVALQKLIGHTRYVTCCAFSLDTGLIATGSNDKTVIIWKLPQHFASVPVATCVEALPGKYEQVSERYATFGDALVPNEYLCPITHDIMKDPVIAADGYTYERKGITEWFEKNGKLTSPMTNSVLSHTQLIPNFTLKMLIQRTFGK